MRIRFPIPLVVAVAAVLAIGVAGSAAALVSGSGAHASITQLKVGLQYPISTFDASQTIVGYQTYALYSENLVQSGPDGKLHPWLAASWRQRNPTTYVYNLRHGVKFWDGNELTAEDVAYSLNYYRQPMSLALHWFTSVKDVKAEGRYTVVVTLKHPDASWPVQPAVSPGIFEKSFHQAHKKTFGQPGTLIMATGPWKLESLNPTSGAELVANENYWHGKVNIDRISFKFFADETSEALAFRGGAIDLAFPSSVTSFAATAATKIINVPGVTPQYLALDIVDPHWSDIHVRRAVAYAVNRQAIGKAYGAPTIPTSTFVPPKQLYSFAPRRAVDALLKSIPQYPTNLAKARAEMAKSKYPHGFKGDFNTLAGYGDREMAQVIAAELKPIGINLTVKTVPVPAWLALLSGPDRSKSGIQLVHPDSYTLDPAERPNANLGSWNAKAGQLNTANWAPKDVDGLITAGIRTLDPA